MPFEVPEVPYTKPEEKDDIFQVERSELLNELIATIKPEELVKLFLTDYDTFLKKFVIYITSDKMKEKHADDINWEYYIKDMKAYFENMDERVMKSKNLPSPLKEGYEDMFAV